MDAGRGGAPTESGGRFAAVSDEQILAAQRELARNDGVFVEPASAAGVAGLLAALEPASGTPAPTVVDHGHRPRAQGHRHRAASRCGDLVDTVVDADVDAAAAAAGLA